MAITNHYTIKDHASLRKIKQLIRKFDPNKVRYIQYAVNSTSFNIFGEGIYNKCIRATNMCVQEFSEQRFFAFILLCADWSHNGHQNLIHL